jgi:transcription elongation factor Elf1
MKIVINTHTDPAIISCPICEKGKFSIWAVKYLKGTNVVCVYCGAVIEAIEETLYDR